MKVLIDAEPYQPGQEDGWECQAAFCPWSGPAFCTNQCKDGQPYIMTKEGRKIVNPGDWIIGGYPIPGEIIKV